MTNNPRTIHSDYVFYVHVILNICILYYPASYPSLRGYEAWWRAAMLHQKINDQVGPTQRSTAQWANYRFTCPFNINTLYSAQWASSHLNSLSSV